MKQKEIPALIFIILLFILSVFGMTKYENMMIDQSGPVELITVFFVFALTAVMIAFCEPKLPVFLFGFIPAAASAIFAEKYGFLFSSLTMLLLLHRFSGETVKNKAYPISALIGDGLCVIPFAMRLSVRLDNLESDIELLKLQNTREHITYKVLLLLLFAFLIFCMIKSPALPKTAGKGKRLSVLFYGVSLLTAVADIGYCVCFTGENVSACVLFSWLFLLLLIAHDGDPVIDRLFPPAQRKVGE